MFGAELRRWRTDHRLSLRALAEHVCYSYSYLAKIELGDRQPPADLATRLDRHFGTGGIFENIYELTRGENALRTGDAQAVPATRRQLLAGIVGTSALAVLAAGRAGPALQFGERKAVEVFQLAHRTLIDQDNIYGPRNLISRVRRQIADIESVLQTTSGADAVQLRFLQARFFEFGGWIYQDLGDHDGAQDWLNVALSRAHLADDPELTCFILARQSQLAGDMGDGRLAVAAAQAASRQAPTSRLAAVAAVYEAHGHALTADRSDCRRSYERASDLLVLEPSIPSRWAAWLDHSYIAVHSAHSMTSLGECTAAIEEYGAALNALGPAFRRDRGVYLARQALAYAGAHDAQSAGAAGLAALEISTETQSGRILVDLTKLATALSRQRTGSAGEFHSALRVATAITEGRRYEL
jgi:transcriptional regulator with XRE-family HTH domain